MQLLEQIPRHFPEIPWVFILDWLSQLDSEVL